jgi:3-hydroxy-9,10-secoandrosta-1,3,5(10)-triene-9,17-dione monooxygenase reductase component
MSIGSARWHRRAEPADWTDAMTSALPTEAGPRFRRMGAHFATGVTVVTSVADDVPVGTTVNAFATVSLDPPMLLVSLRNGSRLLSCVECSGVFAVTVLAADQQLLAKWFASRTRPTGAASFAGIPARPAPVTGCLLLAEGVAYFDCRVSAVYSGGDHTIVLGEVAACDELWPREPLIFSGSGFATVGLPASPPLRN